MKRSIGTPYRLVVRRPLRGLAADVLLDHHRRFALGALLGGGGRLATEHVRGEDVVLRVALLPGGDGGLAGEESPRLVGGVGGGAARLVPHDAARMCGCGWARGWGGYIWSE